jgi:hypothetical protein
MSVLSSSGDGTRVLFEQRGAAIRLFGQDVAASRLSNGVAIPNTPPEYAELVYHDWAQTFHTAALRETDGHPDVEVAQEERRLLKADEIEHLRAVSFSLTVQMDKSLKEAFRSFKGASTTRNSAGVTILQSDTCSAFWEALARYNINMGATRATVTGGERWDAFFSGLQDGANDVAEAVGRTAANVLRSAGEAVGAGAGGFFDSLGVLNTVLVVGLGYAIVRFT